MQLQTIEQRLLEGGTTPSELAEFRVILAGYYARATDELEEILKTKAIRWGEIRKTVKSDTSAERLWEATEDGLKEMHLRFMLKKIDKSTAAISSLINVKTNEAKNYY